MAAERPKRSRKIVNYGEDHLHWVEESQLQKALLRSLNDKGSSPQKSSEKQLVEPDSDKKNNAMKTKQGSGDHSRKSKRKIFEIDDESSDESENDVALPADVSCELRLTRLQSKLLEEAGMLEPTDDIYHSSKQDNFDDNKYVLFESNEESADSESSDPEETTSLSRLRAQRKFAANSSPLSSRSNSPVKMHKQKANSMSKAQTRSKEKQSIRERAVRASTSSVSDITELNSHDKESYKQHKSTKTSQSINKNYPTSSLFNGIPKTDTFLDYLCFRNTTVKIELHDCLKK